MSDGANKRPDSQSGQSPQRIDKWLWYARIAKTRTLAAALVAEGRVRVNRVRVAKPSQTIRDGDVVTFASRGRVLVLKVIAAGVRRGPAAEARSLYEDLSPPPSQIEGSERSGRRPTKRDRRVLDRLTSQE